MRGFWYCHYRKSRFMFIDLEMLKFCNRFSFAATTTTTTELSWSDAPPIFASCGASAAAASISQQPFRHCGEKSPQTWPSNRIGTHVPEDGSASTSRQSQSRSKGQRANRQPQLVEQPAAPDAPPPEGEEKQGQDPRVAAVGRRQGNGARNRADGHHTFPTPLWIPFEPRPGPGQGQRRRGQRGGGQSPPKNVVSHHLDAETQTQAAVHHRGRHELHFAPEQEAEQQRGYRGGGGGGSREKSQEEDVVQLCQTARDVVQQQPAHFGRQRQRRPVGNAQRQRRQAAQQVLLHGEAAGGPPDEARGRSGGRRAGRRQENQAKVKKGVAPTSASSRGAVGQLRLASVEKTSQRQRSWARKVSSSTSQALGRSEQLPGISADHQTAWSRSGRRPRTPAPTLATERLRQRRHQLAESFRQGFAVTSWREEKETSHSGKKRGFFPLLFFKAKILENFNAIEREISNLFLSHTSLLWSQKAVFKLLKNPNFHFMKTTLAMNHRVTEKPFWWHFPEKPKM